VDRVPIHVEQVLKIAIAVCAAGFLTDIGLPCLRGKNMDEQYFLIANGYLRVPAASGEADASAALQAQLGTLLANCASYGYAPSIAALELLRKQDRAGLHAFWHMTEPALKRVTGASYNMGEFVVYKNFPDEVLDMSEAGYWIRQICMYVGAPNEWFTTQAIERPMLDERLSVKVLDLAGPDVLERISASLKASRFRWTDLQQEHALHLLATSNVPLDLSVFGFKENGVRVIAASLGQEREILLQDATDVLRLAAQLSDSDVTLRGDVKFSSFNRQRRRQLVTLLEAAPNLEEDLGTRPRLFKQLLSRLHPGDFGARRLCAAYDRLYRGDIQTHNARIERLLGARDDQAIALISARPGDFARRLYMLCSNYGALAASTFLERAGSLPTSRLLQLERYLRTIGSRKTLVYPPRGSWSKAQVKENAKVPLESGIRSMLAEGIAKILSRRLALALPEGVALDRQAEKIKLPTNDQELAPYGRGTRFSIPAEVRFVRTASYWQAKREGNVWYDNGWNFLNSQFKPTGTVSWNSPKITGAAFSGDPTNTKDSHGRACQLIDLDLDTLAAGGVRYAIWNVLAYSHLKFSEADLVCAALQWGEDARAGGLFEPARAQMVFPLKGGGYTKYVAYLDLQQRELVYMDADLGGTLSSAKGNEARVASLLPAYLEYLDSLPTVADLFTHAPTGSIPVLYSDGEVDLPRGQLAYVFQRRNAGNEIKPLELALLLGK